MERCDDLMFTPAVATLQEAEGAYEIYTRSDGARTRLLNADEVDFITGRASFYMVSVSDTGCPYVQHRGGPAGFLNVVDDDTLAFADYRGNRRHIGDRNVMGDDRVSLYLMDEPRKARMKLQGHATFEEATKNPDLAARFAVDGQKRVEWLVTIRLVAFDWNCPQFFAPRFDADAIEQLVGPEMGQLTTRIAERETGIAALTERK